VEWRVLGTESEDEVHDPLWWGSGCHGRTIPIGRFGLGHRDTCDVRSLLISPIEPLPTGNGLAMRAGVWLDSLARYGEVGLAVMPLAGDLTVSPWADERCRHRWRLEAEPADAVSSLADPYWRDQLAELEPRPALAVAAWPGAGLRLADVVGATGFMPEVVICLRSYVAPVAAAAAARMEARLVVDLDDDDVSVAPDGEAEVWRRLVARVAAWADVIAAASPTESELISARLGTPVVVLPNVVPPRTPVPLGPEAEQQRILFVGNLTYGPNRDAVYELVRSILRRLTDARLSLVGNARDEDVRAWTENGRVTYLGWVDDLAPVYDACDVVVVPIRSGGGTRIKVLEAMAYCRPVVATTAAVAGLNIDHGRHALIRDDADEMVSAIESLRDRGLAAPLVTEAWQHVQDHHHPDRAHEIVGRMIGAVDIGGADAVR
jgi:glycosyltransferase involved in cell wall biosynthesis